MPECRRMTEVQLMAADIDERMDKVLGKPPRVSALDADALDDRHRGAIEHLRILHGNPEGKPLHSFFGTLAHSPDCFAGFMDLGVAISSSTALDPRSRELLILRTGWLCGAPYQWGEHVIVAKREGMTSDEIERVTAGSEAEDWSERDRAILRAAEELHAQAMIRDETWDALRDHFGERELVEIPLVVGHYHMTAFLQNSVRIPLNANNPGLSAR